MAVTASLAWQPTLANLLIAFLDRRPGDAEGDFLLARVAAMLIVSTVESRPENIQRMRRQMVAHGWRKVFVARVRHRDRTRLIVLNGYDLPPISWTPDLSGFSLCLLWRDVAEGGGKPLTMIVSFDIGKQVSFRGWDNGSGGRVRFSAFQSSVPKQRSKAAFQSSVPKQRSKAAFHRRVDAPISVKGLSGAKSTIVERRINSRGSHGRRSA